jgi:hypothetical protein
MHNKCDLFQSQKNSIATDMVDVFSSTFRPQDQEKEKTAQSKTKCFF